MTAFCTAVPDAGGAHPSSGGGPPPSVVAPAVVVPVVGLAGLGLLAWWLAKAGMLGGLFGTAGTAGAGAGAAPVSGGPGAAPTTGGEGANPVGHESWNGVSGDGHGWSGVSGQGTNPPMQQAPIIPPIVAGGYRRESSEEATRPYNTRRLSSRSSGQFIPRKPVGSPPPVSPTDNVSMSEASGMPISELAHGRPDEVGWSHLDGNQLYEAPGHQGQQEYVAYRGQQEYAGQQDYTWQGQEQGYPQHEHENRGYEYRGF